MKGTKEFDELQKQFENDIKKTIYGHKIERAVENLPKDVFYNDGYVNNLFKAYMLGYSYRKAIKE